MNAKFRSVRLYVLIIVFACLPAVAQTTDPDKTLSPYFFVNGDPAVDHLPLKNTNVDIAISGIIADVRVTQTYLNEGLRPINATYIFPASTRAAVYSMRMKIGNQVIVAKVKEREKAKEEFEAAKKEGKSASLLEENRPNVFSMKLANLMPREQIDIELRYTELLLPTAGIYELVYPTVVGPRYPSPDSASAGPVNAPYLRAGSQPTSSLHISAKVAAGVPIDYLACASHQVTPEWFGQTVARISLDDADPFQGNRDFVLQYRLKGAQIASGLLLFPEEDENFFLYMAQPPKRVEAETIPPREYVFVVDVSGSMDGFPLNTSKQLLRDLIGQLRPTDFFNVVLFAGDSNVLAEQSISANEENIGRAIELIERQRGMGGTELLPAIQRAMNLRREPGTSRSVVLVTDGYVSGEQGVFDHIRQNLNQSNLFAFGIGSSVNRYLIEGVARAGMGEPFIVENESYAADAANKFREYIQTPVLTQIQVRMDGFDAYDVYPTQIPDLLAERPIVVFGKYRGNPSGTIELSGMNGLGAYKTELDVSTVPPDESNRALRYLWARHRISELSFEAYEPSEQIIREITDLGIKYNLLTRYTSFIAVREVVTNPDGSAQDVNQPLPLPVGVSDMAVGSEPELVWLLTLLAMLSIFLIGRRRARLLRA